MSANPKAVDVLTAMKELDRIARGAEIPFPHWLGGDEADQGSSYCFDCASKKVAAGEAESVDGGWHQDSDGCCHCEDCGRLLDYTLTDYGVKSELEHFSGDDLKRPMDAELAYHLAKLLDRHEEHPEVLVLVPRITAALARCGGAK